MNNSNDTIGNRNRDLPTCSAVPQPTALPAACTLLFPYALFNYCFSNQNGVFTARYGLDI